ncbi:hypothetical protein QQ045_017514 [Rhodiola kirilowii]
MVHQHDVRAKLPRLRELEIEAEELRLTNGKLQLENSDLALRLQLAEVSVIQEQEAVNLKEENERLKRKNKDLGQEIEQLQADRCADAEELVYLRWVNACLRYELRFNNPHAGKSVAMDLSKSLSPKSAEKAKKLILKYAATKGGGDREFDLDSNISSLTSCPTESGTVEDSLAGDNSSNPINVTSEPKFLRKLRKFLNTKHETRKARENSEEVVTSIGDNMHAYAKTYKLLISISERKLSSGDNPGHDVSSGFKLNGYPEWWEEFRQKRSDGQSPSNGLGRRQGNTSRSPTLNRGVPGFANAAQGGGSSVAPLTSQDRATLSPTLTDDQWTTMLDMIKHFKGTTDDKLMDVALGLVQLS